MKKLALYTLAVMTIWGCRKAELPLEKLTETDIFDPTDKNGTYALQYLNSLYTTIPTGFNRVDGNFLCTATDDAMPSGDNTRISDITFSRLSNATAHPDDSWAKNYEAIRRVNYFLAHVDEVPRPADLPLWKAEVRFLRALNYFELVKRYGGVPLLGDKVFETADNLQLPRNSFEECINYIVSECDAVKNTVYTEAQVVATTSLYGRATRGAVVAVKSRALLYAASPLFNGGVPAGANAAQVKAQGYPVFDAERWNKAAQAAKELMSLNYYALSTSFNDVFLTRGTTNKEVILAYNRTTASDIERNNGPVGFSGPALGLGRTSPTQNLVDAFGTLAGRPISEAGSGYNPNNPYANRDPRLAFTVLANGASWLGRPVETFEGGLDNPRAVVVKTKTGYYLRKFMGNFTSATEYTAVNHNFPVFRYAEILLNFAEAQNEYAGPTAEVVKAITDLRKRAGITAGTGSLYGLPAVMTKEQMREVIRNERRVELAFEEQRYWDLRRWKIAETVLNGNLQGMRITRNGSTFSYQPQKAGSVTFEPRMYSYAIPFEETLQNNALIQNFGW